MASDVTPRLSQSVNTRRSEWSRRPVAFLPRSTIQVAKIFDRQYHSPSKVLKLEDDPWGSCAMYSPDKMKSGGGLMAPPGCFPARYSPTYRTTDPRRCVPNPSVSTRLYNPLHNTPNTNSVHAFINFNTTHQILYSRLSDCVQSFYYLYYRFQDLVVLTVSFAGSSVFLLMQGELFY